MAISRHAKVFTVLSFLRMRSPDIYWYQWIYPTAIFIAIACSYYFMEGEVFTLNKAKLIEDVNSLMGILIGFYIAALAAVSSFTNENLDQVMKGRAPTILMRRQGKEIRETLTRRRFLAVLFGYCASLAIILYILGVFQSRISFLQPSNEYVEAIINFGTILFWSVYVWIISSLLIVTLLGLHYLVERMHRA